MPKSSKLLSALDRRKGRNYKLEKQRGQEKAARKRKNQYQNRNGDAIVRENADGTQSDSHGDWEDEEAEKTLAKKVCSQKFILLIGLSLYRVFSAEY